VAFIEFQFVGGKPKHKLKLYKGHAVVVSL